MSILSSVGSYVLGVLVVCVAAFYLYAKYAYTYWKRKKIPHLAPRFPFGNIGNPIINPTQPVQLLKQVYDELKSRGHKHGGCYVLTVPFYMPIHRDYLENVMSKYFNHFMNRGLYRDEKADPLSGHFLALEGEKWKKLRQRVSPAFTPGRTKAMFDVIVKCSAELENLVRSYSEEKRPLDIKNALSKFTGDVVGSVSFGIDCNSFNDPNSEVVRHGRRIFNLSKRDKLNLLFFSTFPKLAHMIGVRTIPKEVADFFLNLVRETVTYRDNNKNIRKDLIQILIDLKNNPPADPDPSNTLTVEQIAAHAFLFFLAGFETSSSAMAFCLFELTQNQMMQEKVRNEVTAVVERCDGEITFDGIQEMKYLDQVFAETLRKYPPVPLLNRKCNERYNVPNTDVVIEKGVPVLIPIYAVHRDPEYYPDPDKFDPERFSEENKKQRHPFTYIPFGEGPRICLGIRFGLIQSKAGLAVLLKNYKFTLNKRTQVPLKMDPYSFVLSAVEGIWLDVTPV